VFGPQRANPLKGSVSQILQSAYVGQENIKASSSQLENADIKDIPDMFSYSGFEDGGDILQLRRILESVTRYDLEANMWNEYATVRDRSLGIFTSHFANSDDNKAQSTFLSELPYNFSTGVIGPQYAPRISSKRTT
jgi:hypothetical protein